VFVPKDFKERLATKLTSVEDAKTVDIVFRKTLLVIKTSTTIFWNFDNDDFNLDDDATLTTGDDDWQFGNDSIVDHGDTVGGSDCTCLLGGCDQSGQTGCEPGASCVGGMCNQDGLISPTCTGGKCSQRYTTDASCEYSSNEGGDYFLSHSLSLSL